MRKVKAAIIGGAMVVLAGCAGVEVSTNVPQTAPAPQASPAPDGPRVSGRRAAANFDTVVRRVEPVAERFCRARAPGLNCDFQIIIDRDAGNVVNAFQTLGPNGVPIIGFTPGLIAEARTQDELAFVMAHEAAHHIEGHIGQTQQNAALGGLLATTLAGALGASDVGLAGRIGSTVAARSYSKEFELEADALGTVITDAAGYDPVKGAEFFNRIPDPGDRFLGTHPPNADRIRTVRRVAAGL